LGSGTVGALYERPLFDFEAKPIRRRCGALLEHSGIYERMSAEDNLQLYARIWRPYRRPVRRGEVAI
jgi:ABC-type multidrug transport system ATPase subunit